uniref:Ig-like domain-containing protein n=1 Tax=Neogobius melanostomus TaxID=47308 RepID=A0A8C6TID8_9GOBI
MESALCTLLSALVVLLCSSPECKGEDTVTQPEGDASVFKGDTATINCTFETSDRSPNLYWYKQEGHGAPQYMMKIFGSGIKVRSSDFKESRFDADLKGKSVYLKIQDVRVSDSAVYYCALRPTVTGNTKTLNKNLWRKLQYSTHPPEQGWPKWGLRARFGPPKQFCWPAIE